MTTKLRRDAARVTMKQSAEERPIPNLQRQAAIARGAATDHTGSVQVTPIKNFDLGHTIFNTLEGALPRFVIKTRIAKEHRWNEPASENIGQEYEAVRSGTPLPEVDPALLRFMVEECDFDVEHADGSFGPPLLLLGIHPRALPRAFPHRHVASLHPWNRDQHLRDGGRQNSSTSRSHGRL